MKIVSRLVLQGISFLLLVAPLAYGQFSSNVQGSVMDPSGASVVGAAVTIANLDTAVSQTQTTDERGSFRFGSLPPGVYQVDVVARGFSNERIKVTLTTAETRGLPITLRVASETQAVQVQAQAPVLDTADSRIQLTLESKEFHSLPLPGENFLGLTALAPGVEGLGVTVGTNPSANSSGLPSQIPDNFATELPVDASANGRSLMSNMFVVDGLDVTSNISGGTANLSPNPDSVQEYTIQTNTFTVEYGRSGSIVAAATTKSGTEVLHGSVSDFFTNQHLWARTVFTGPKYAPFKSNNISATLGGPILPHKHSYFFVSVEPLRTTFSTGNQLYYFEHPQFVQWAQQNFPGSIGTQLLTHYPIKSTSDLTVAETANDVFGPDVCGTPAAANIPCDLPMVANGTYDASPYRNGLQYNVRADQYFGKDRVYGNFYRMVHNDQSSSVRSQMDTTSHYSASSLQVNETHTFSPTVLNEAMFGYLKVEGIADQTAPFSVPVINVAGGVGMGVGFAQGDFIQHNYRWRDVLTLVHKSHSLKMGYEGWRGDDLALFATAYSQPNFSFNNLLDLVQDNPHSEGNLAYNPLTGEPEKGQYLYAATTHGIFFQDTWQARRNLTLTLGVRWDDYGNPYPESGTTLANFFLGSGLAQTERIANGSVIQVNHVFNHPITAFSPRVGVAWDPTGHGNWVVRGGFGIYRDWPTLGIDENSLKGNPPGFILPTFLTGTTNPPIFALGTSNTYPFGYPYPSLPPATLDSHGGLQGAQLNVGGIDPNLKSPRTYTYVGSVQHQLPGKLVASVGYSGSHSLRLLTGSVLNQFPGTDINRFAGDLVVNKNVLTRLNNSFGTLSYTTNGGKATYNALITTLERRFSSGGRITASYTRSRSWDDGQMYPDQNNIGGYWQPSPFDVANRFSMTAAWPIPAPSHVSHALGMVVKGWQISGTSVVQSGLPFSVYTSASFQPVFDDNGNVIGFANGSGDYNADGYNYDVPNITKGYNHPTGRSAYLNGIFSVSDFGVPELGQEGNEKMGRFRGPGFFDVDAALVKDTHFTERINLQLRLECFNLLNHTNLSGVDSNLADASFGKSTAVFNPRWLQIAAKITF